MVEIAPVAGSARRGTSDVNPNLADHVPFAPPRSRLSPPGVGGWVERRCGLSVVGRSHCTNAVRGRWLTQKTTGARARAPGFPHFPRPSRACPGGPNSSGPLCLFVCNHPTEQAQFADCYSFTGREWVLINTWSDEPLASLVLLRTWPSKGFSLEIGKRV